MRLFPVPNHFITDTYFMGFYTIKSCMSSESANMWLCYYLQDSTTLFATSYIYGRVRRQ
jgi:hypothetical protein